MKYKSIKVNAIFNVTRKLLSIVFPLVSYPYVLRILGSEGVGRVSFASSIISYFSMLAMLGASTYAVREGAKVRNDKRKFDEIASQIFSITIVSTFISFFFLFLVVLLFDNLVPYRMIFAILSLTIVFQVFSVDWVNTIFEDYAFITVRSIFVYVINLLFLYIFIKKPEDYIKYAVLTVVPSGIICVTNWFYCRKYVRLHLTKDLNLSLHLKPLLVMFANTAAISIYVNFDTTMLGWFKGDYYVGIYTVVAKIYNVVKYGLAAIYAVTIPRLASYAGNGQKEQYRMLYSKTWGILSLFLIPASIGLICFSGEIILLFGGKEYLEAAVPLQILSIALIFAIFGGLITACLNITIGKENTNLIATIISAVCNFILNLLFIPLWGVVGASITTAISELVVLCICFIKVPDKSNYFDYDIIKINLLHSLIGTVLIILTVLILKPIISSVILKTIIIIPCAVLIYFAFLIFVRNTLFINTISQFVRKVLRR